MMYLRIGAGQYYLVTFLDEYSRYVVNWELLCGMDGMSVSLAAQAALDTLEKTMEGKLIALPAIRSDNGSCYFSRDFRSVLEQNGLAHQRIKPNCPEENGLVERSNRTLGEALKELEDEHRRLKKLLAEAELDKAILKEALEGN